MDKEFVNRNTLPWKITPMDDGEWLISVTDDTHASPKVAVVYGLSLAEHIVKVHNACL